MNRWVKIPFVAALGLAALAVAPYALADEPCSLADLTCVVGGAAGDAEDVVDQITDPVDEITDPIVQPILDEVDEILGRKGPIDPPGSGGGGSGGGQGGGGTGMGHAGDRPPIGSGIGHQQTFERATGLSQGDARPRGTELTPEVRAQGIGPILTGAARSVLVFLVLLGIALGFVLIQDRLDRNEPKLALARISPDILGFE